MLRLSSHTVQKFVPSQATAGLIWLLDATALMSRPSWSLTTPAPVTRAPRTSKLVSQATKKLVPSDVTAGWVSPFVVAETGNVNAGSGDRWIDTVPPLDPVFFQLFGVDYPSKFDPIPVDPRGILGIGSEAGGNVTVIAGGNVSTRSGDPSVVRTEGTATGAPPSSLNPLPPTTYDGSHIGVFGQAYQTVEFPSGLFSVDSVRVPIADAPKAKLTVISGGDIAGDYVIRNGTATLRAGYSLDQSALGQIEADPSALQAIEASADPATRAQIHLSDGATADPTVGWLGSLRSPLTVDLAFASVDGRGANGIALRAAENPSLVYPQSSKSAVGTAKIPLYDETDSLTLDAERGDIVLLGNEDVIPEAGNALAASSPNPYVHELPPWNSSDGCISASPTTTSFSSRSLPAIRSATVVGVRSIASP